MNFLDKTGLTYLWEKIKTKLSTKQDVLVSGTNIKTINGNSILGSGDIVAGSTFKSIMGLTITDKTYSLGAWSSINVTSDFVELFKDNDGIIFENGQIKISPSATFKYIELSFYIYWLIPWTTDQGNRGIYLYKNETRISTDYNTCPKAESSWYSDTYSWLLPVEPGDYFTIAIVRGGQSGSLETDIERGYIKICGI